MACAMLSISIDTQFVLWNLNTVFENLAIDYGIEGVFGKTAVINFIEYHYFYLFGVAYYSYRRVRNYLIIGNFLSMHSDIL